jgi:DNA-binding SARP family transcriptional activator/ABC-type glycerol-3-phosphate transport system substrate-binding protein
MEFRVLGELEVLRAGERVSLGSFKQRSLLALLLVHAGRVVPTDRILEELWGDDAGADHQGALWVHVSNLRSALEPDRARRSEGTVVLTRNPGYVIEVAPDAIDAARFEALLREGRTLLEHDPAAASIVAAEGLALWRGRAYEDVTYEDFAQAEIARLEELRLEAVELRLDADLRCGLASELVGELEALVRLHPLRERFTAQHMVALHRAGRRSDALRAYAALGARLGEELGIEPSGELRRLEAEILADDSVVGRRRTAPGGPSRLAVRGYELREQIDDGTVGPAFRAYQPLVGREVSIRIVRSELADDPDFVRRFEAEAEAVARLEHPHIVPLYDYWREPGAAYLVTRWFRGGTLARALEHGSLPVADAGRLVVEIGSALALAHRRGVVHGAVEPANVCVDDDGRAYLAGFGLAALVPAAVETGVDRASPPWDDAPTARSSDGGGISDVDGVAADVRGLAGVLTAALLARPVDDPARETDSLPPALADAVRQATVGPGFADVESFTAAVATALGPEPPAIAGLAVTNPYKGLRAFEEADAGEFFGRERVVERLLARAGEGGSRGRLVLLVGPSGSGKSSAVRAGLLPALRHGARPGSADWFVVDMTPGADPFAALAAALRRVAVDPPPDLLDDLTAGEAGLLRALQVVLPDDHSQLLLVVDQFEELFTQAPEATAHAFLDALVAAVVRSPSRLRVVCTLRADCYDRPLAHRTFGELVRHGTEVITPMTPGELERAIAGPCEQVGVRFEPGLVAQILADVVDRPGALPLLQYALTELFERRRGPVIPLATYREMGGAAGALVHRAEAWYDELDGDTRATARQVLLRLVTIADDGTLARRRALRQELTTLGPARVDAVLEGLGEHRLVSFDHDPVTRGPIVEIAHEALLWEWHRLRTWIDDSRDGVRQQRRVAQAAAEWHAAGRDDESLLRGPHLDRAAAWTATTDLALSPLERDFVAASQAQRDRERAEHDAQRRREEELRRTARRRSRLLVGSTAVLAVLVALAAFAFDQRREAQELADDLGAIGEARRLASLATVTAVDDPELATLLALQSLEVSERAGIPALVEAEEALHWALQAASVPYPADATAVQARVGPNGLTGIYHLELADLVATARAHVTRALAPHECERYAVDPCPSDGVVLASPAASGSPRLPADPPTQEVEPGTGSLVGTSVVIATLQATDDPGFAAELARFQIRTGIRVAVRTVTGDDLATDFADTGLPDLLVSLDPLAVRDLAADGELVDVGVAVPQDAARQAVGDHLVDVVRTGAGYYALPLSLQMKGLVWYRAPDVAAAGYALPRTWDELVALSGQLVADGRTPWCMGFQSGGSDGWVGTDWVEALVLRLGGLDFYDRWVAHEVPFDHPVVVEALDRFGEIAFGDNFVLGGSEAIGRTAYDDAILPLLDEPPSCWMEYQASFLRDYVPPAVVGPQLRAFVLPPIEAGTVPPVLGGASFVSALADRPEVRELLRWIASPEWGTTWSAEVASDFLPTNAAFDSRRCAADSLDAAANDVRVQLCEEVRRAIEADTFRVDASDQMPPAIGQGAFWAAMLDYVEGGPAQGAAVLAAVEEAWPTG